jgi:hypothetical protein
MGRMQIGSRVQTLSAIAGTVFAGLAFAQAMLTDGPAGPAPVVPAVAAVVAASPRERALATLKAITPGMVQRRFDQEQQWHQETLLKLYEEVGRCDPTGDVAVVMASSARTDARQTGVAAYSSYVPLKSWIVPGSKCHTRVPTSSIRS